MKTEKLRLGIVGAGFVGGSVINGFNKNVDQFVVDPAHNDNTIDMLIEFNPSITFICVPTPKSIEHADVDVSAVRQVLSDLYDRNYKGIAAIKSTITPKHLTTMKKDFGIRIVYNPEFLTEANAHADFINPNMQVLGGKWKDCDTIEKAYNRHSSVKVVPTFKVDLVTASLIKYTINSWLATKVIFFNELRELHDASGAITDWETFTEMLTNDPRMGNTHMRVPGPDGEKGFGGHCFPKDTDAFLHYAGKKDVDLSVLKKAVSKNNKIKGQ